MGMERFRTAGAQMSTIFFRHLPQYKSTSPSTSDIEKPAPGSEVIDRYNQVLGDLASGSLGEDNHLFAWRGLSLDLSNKKRLLHEVTGMSQCHRYNERC
jgi:hypothetical protein